MIFNENFEENEFINSKEIMQDLKASSVTNKSFKTPNKT